MNLQDAMNIMEINEIGNLSLEKLKKKYHKLALLHHPDKNGNSADANEKFQKIGHAYDILKKELIILDGVDGLGDLGDLGDSNSYNNSNSSSYENNTGYSFILNMFIQSIYSGKYNEIISSVIKDIIVGCKEISLKMFEKLDKEKTLMVYDFILKYKNIFRLDDSILNNVREILVEKFKNIQIYIINPSIDDLFENNIYKLEVNKQIYFVPLWHSELYFDGDNDENNDENNVKDDIIVKCIPELPNYISIDENNNLIVMLEIPLNISLIQQKKTVFLIGKKIFEIPIDKLYCKQVQSFIFKNMGISQIDESCDIYNIDKKGDVIVNITFV